MALPLDDKLLATQWLLGERETTFFRDKPLDELPIITPKHIFVHINNTSWAQWGRGRRLREGGGRGGVEEGRKTKGRKRWKRRRRGEGGGEEGGRRRLRKGEEEEEEEEKDGDEGRERTMTTT